MDKRKVESLRDLAIAHFPKAREKRAQAIRHSGHRFADTGLQSAYLYRDPEWTAVEKQARDLLELTFNHPDALAEYPFNLDAAEDADMIASNARGLEAAVYLQPQTEAAMLDAARLLCELTGAALPPWVDDAPAQDTATPAPAVAAGASGGPGWSLKPSPIRMPGYRWPLYQFLQTAHVGGEPCPKAQHVLDAWKLNPPQGMKVIQKGKRDLLEYELDTGDKKTADLKAIQATIDGLIASE